MLICNCVVTQLFWSRRMRRNLVVVFVISLLINVGMWFERFDIIVVSLVARLLARRAGTATRRRSSTSASPRARWGFFGLLFLGYLRLVPFVPAR